MSTKLIKFLDDSTPYNWFESWLDDAKEAIAQDPNAMSLATTDPDGSISIRVVLLKAWDERGFVFYTNSESRKGRAMASNDRVGLSFYWPSLNRQIRISGRVEKGDDSESDAYFESRALQSKLGAWASDQSRPLDSRESLLARVADFGEKFGEEVPRPTHWFGYRVVPTDIEFWEAGEFRLHDRWLWKLGAQGWSHERLNP